MSAGPGLSAAENRARAAESMAVAPGGAMSRAAAAVAPALAQAARRTGVDFNALLQTARLESGFNPEARARTSSATGLFQFLEGTWMQVLQRHGARHGLTPATREEALAMRTDPLAASLMAAEHMADNARKLGERLGRAVGPVDLYLAHFLGPAGAGRFLERLAEAPGAAAADLFPAAARANRAIFFDGGTPRSLEGVHALFARRLGADQGGAPATMPGLLPAGPAEAAPAPGSDPAARLADLLGGTARPGDGAPALPPAQVARIAYLLLADLTLGEGARARAEGALGPLEG